MILPQRKAAFSKYSWALGHLSQRWRHLLPAARCLQWKISGSSPAQQPRLPRGQALTHSRLPVVLTQQGPHGRA